MNKFQAKGAEGVAAMAHGLALNALQSGQRTYCPELVKASALAAGIDTWGIAIDAIEGAAIASGRNQNDGWQLVHWAVDGGVARPVFRRVVLS